MWLGGADVGALPPGFLRTHAIPSAGIAPLIDRPLGIEQAGQACSASADEWPAAGTPRPGTTKPPRRRGFLGARPRGLEPLTFGSVDRRSIQLSYGRWAVRQRSLAPASFAAESGEGGIRTRERACRPLLA